MLSVPAFQPLIPEGRDQGDPYLLTVSGNHPTMWKHYVYITGEDAARKRAFPLYGSNDLRQWQPLGESLVMAHQSAHWAPCVVYRPGLAKPFVMLYSCSKGFGDLAHVGHAIRRAESEQPEGPFVDTGQNLTPEIDFAIDPDVYTRPDGRLMLAFAKDFNDGEPHGVAIVEVEISDDLTELRGEFRLLTRPRYEWQVFDPARSTSWKAVPIQETSQETVRWSNVEAPVGGLVSPSGKPVYLYSGGCFFGFYAIGALIEEDGELRDVTDDDPNFVVRPQLDRGIYAPGHCSLIRDGDEVIGLMLHARFGTPQAPRQMCVAPLQWREDDLPVAVLPFSDSPWQRFRFWLTRSITGGD